MTMSLASNTFQNKWLTDVLTYVQSALQVLLFIFAVVALGVAWWRYQSTVFVISEIKLDPKRPVIDSGLLTSSNSQPVDFYTDLVDKRNIFSFDTGSAPSPEAVSPVSQDLMTRYVVQGIVHDHNPMAIIKDIQSNKTYFVHRTEILEGAKLVEIRENRVIFDRNGEALELIKK